MGLKLEKGKLVVVKQDDGTYILAQIISTNKKTCECRDGVEKNGPILNILWSRVFLVEKINSPKSGEKVLCSWNSSWSEKSNTATVIKSNGVWTSVFYLGKLYRRKGNDSYVTVQYDGDPRKLQVPKTAPISSSLGNVPVVVRFISVSQRPDFQDWKNTIDEKSMEEESDGEMIDMGGDSDNEVPTKKKAEKKKLIKLKKQPIKSKVISIKDKKKGIKGKKRKRSDSPSKNVKKRKLTSNTNVASVETKTSEVLWPVAIIDEEKLKSETMCEPLTPEEIGVDPSTLENVDKTDYYQSHIGCWHEWGKRKPLKHLIVGSYIS